MITEDDIDENMSSNNKEEFKCMKCKKVFNSDS